MRRALLRLAVAAALLAAAFVAHANWLDERIASWSGALPVRAYATSATSDRAHSGLAVDAAQQTAWDGRVGARQWWDVAFPEPVRLRGLVVDTGNDVFTTITPHVLARGPGGALVRFPDLERRRRFSCWVQWTMTPTLTHGVRIKPFDDARTKSGRWTLRDVRFLVEGPVPVDGAARAEVLRRSGWPAVAALLFLACWFGGRRPRAGAAAAAGPSRAPEDSEAPRSDEPRG